MNEHIRYGNEADQTLSIRENLESFAKETVIISQDFSDEIVEFFDHSRDWRGILIAEA